MKFSLLEKTKEKSREFDVIYDLSLDRAAESVCGEEAAYFLSVVSKPLMLTENIVYRQNILRDFLSNDKLYDEFRLLCTRYDKIRADRQAMRLVRDESIDASPEALLEYTYASLRSTAVFPDTLASFYRSIREVLCRYDISSEGLVSIREYCESMLQSEAICGLLEVAHVFRHGEPEDMTFTVSEKLGEDMRSAVCELCSADPTGELERTGIKNLFSRAKAKDEVILKNEGEAQSDALYALSHSLARVDLMLSEITDRVYEAFYGISRELLFYSAAMKLCQRLDAAEVGYTFPEMRSSEENAMNITELRDLLLICEGMTVHDTVPNDVMLSGETEGIIVKGRTDSGKTVFLRSVGTAQLLAQCGMPLPCASAEISVKRGVFTHFSSAEEEFVSGDTAGRFEGEARAVARLLSLAEPNSLVLLNETFQSTSYDEGAAAIYNVLRALGRIGVKFVFVTHLTKLYDMYESGAVILSETSEDEKYKVRRLK